MKNHILTVLAFLLSIFAMAQAPQGIPYQAMARNSSGTILASATISVRFTVRDSIATGAIKYRETFSVTTTSQGMFNVNVGQGTLVSGTFAGINWGTNAKFMQVEMDPSGGSSYVDMGTQQMMSVPYAKYAETSGTAVSGGSGFTHYVGEIWGGGVVYHVYRGADGNEHGLIVSINDQSTSSTWSNVVSSYVGTTAQDVFEGLANSNAIAAQAGHTSSAAKICLDLVSGGQSDWYLPSIEELRCLSSIGMFVNKTLASISGADLLVKGVSYWSSTEYVYATPAALSYGLFDYPSHGSGYSYKSYTNYVRAIRSF
jgi:hypothetical protein